LNRRPPLYVHSLTEDDQQTLQAGLRSSEAVILRRCQLRLASARGQTARVIAETWGCDDQPVRNASHAFTTRGQTALTRRSSARQRTPHAAFTPLQREQLRALLPQSPPTLGHPTRLGTLPWAAEVAYAEGLTARPVRGEASRRALVRLGVRWQRAKHWITSPDPAYIRKKNAATG
jgi:hypothetical protein